MKKFRVYVTYKPSVFDPQGDTITDAAKDLGYQTIQAIHVGKFFDISLILKLTIQRERLPKRLKN